MKTTRITIHIEGLDDDGVKRNIDYDLTSDKYEMSFYLVQTRDLLDGETDAEPWKRDVCPTGHQRLELSVGLLNKEDAKACIEFSAKHRSVRHVSGNSPFVPSPVTFEPPPMQMGETLQEAMKRHPDFKPKIVSAERVGLDQSPDTTQEMQDLVKASRVAAAKELAEIPIAAQDDTISVYEIPNSLVNVLRAIVHILYPTVDEKYATKFCLDLAAQKLGHTNTSEEMVGVEKLVQREWKHLAQVR